jgi:hypothetical protein
MIDLETQRKRAREWRLNNPEKYKLIAQKSRLKHKEKRYRETKIWVSKNKLYVRKYLKAWRLNNAEKIKGYSLINSKKWYYENKNQKLLKNKEWRLNNLSHFKNLTYLWYIKNKSSRKLTIKKWGLTEKGKHSRHLSRIKRRTNFFNAKLKSTHKYSDWENLLIKSRGYCCLCNKFIGIKNLTKDHIYPISKTSFVDDSIQNIQAVCKSCNSSKKDKTLKEFKAYILERKSLKERFIYKEALHINGKS